MKLEAGRTYSRNHDCGGTLTWALTEDFSSDYDDWVEIEPVSIRKKPQFVRNIPVHTLLGRWIRKSEGCVTLKILAIERVGKYNYAWLTEAKVYFRVLTTEEIQDYEILPSLEESE